jgi:hypothetical protein
MSKGAWCCGSGDGNTWFGDTYFNVNNWKRGLQYMADHVSQTTLDQREELTVTSGQTMA